MVVDLTSSGTIAAFHVANAAAGVGPAFARIVRAHQTVHYPRWR
jgi:hypothetical protein